jgi:hypothetical protein
MRVVRRLFLCDSRPEFVERRQRKGERRCRFSSMLITYSSATASKNSDMLAVYQFALTSAATVTSIGSG